MAALDDIQASVRRGHLVNCDEDGKVFDVLDVRVRIRVNVRGEPACTM
jgi:hypothetical protein